METFLSIPEYILLFLTLYFEVFLLLTYFENMGKFRHIPPAPKEAGAYPSVTIVVPAWNEERTLKGTVESLLRLDYPRDKLSIFIVDDGSTDNTLTVANQYATHPQIRVFSKENGGKHTALNLGIERSQSEFLGCLDADSFVSANALKEIIPYFDDPKVMAVTPSIQIHEPKNVLERIQSVEYMVGQFSRKILSRLNALYVAPGPFSIYRKSAFATVGGFVDGYKTEDMEMALRLQSHRMKIENAHGALVYTVSPKTAKSLYKQRVRWISGFLKNAFFKYRRMFFSREYGNLGLLTMPFAFGSIFITLFFSMLYAKSIAHVVYERYVQYSAIGFRFDLGWPHFDWFSLNIGARPLLITVLFCTTLFLIISGVILVTRRLRITRDMFYFVFLYGLLVPFWLVGSLYNFISAKDVNWR